MLFITVQRLAVFEWVCALQVFTIIIIIIITIIIKW